MTPGKLYVGPKRVNSFLQINSARRGISVLAIDPGGTTGWSLLNLANLPGGTWNMNFSEIMENKISWEHGEVDTRGNENKAVESICNVIKLWPTAAVVLEDFILRPERRESSRDLLSPVRINAILTHTLWRQGRTPILQSPQIAKTTCTDLRLKEWNCYTPDGGLGHARDADRHIILFVRRCMGDSVQSKKLRETAWG